MAYQVFDFGVPAVISTRSGAFAGVRAPLRITSLRSSRSASRLLMLVPALWLSAATGCAQLVGARAISARGPERTTFHQITVGHDRRTFLLHRPAAATGSMPLIFVLHGTSANANEAMEESGMNAVADSIGALVVYPNGTGGIPYIRLFWNTEHCCDGETRRGVDEVGMVRAIVDSLAAYFPIDRSRIALAGFSDAGSMAYLLACDASDLLTTIAVVSGELPATSCAPRIGVSTIVFHGTADRNLPYGHTDRSVATWAQRERCATSRVDTMPGVVRARYDDCADGAAVELNTIVGGKHAWPGGKPSWFLAPAPSRAVNASRVIAAFLVQHPRAPR